MKNLLEKISNAQNIGIYLMHVAIFVIFIWIGGLKFVNYEAEGITPFIANSPVGSWLYNDPSQYKQNKAPEGKTTPEQEQWHEKNNTYGASKFIGILIMLYGTLVLAGIYKPILGVIGGLLVAAMTFITLSFLLTTPETFVGGFPNLSGAGRLVIKDLALLCGGLIVAGFNAKRVLKSCKHCA
ncbi:YkgB family protein [Campylobacter fetus]|uniref:YkgB family protein n=1 Tax=Campylobacter fetus TaxID=196 RepID=UPI000818A571|nr:YkgB family protein [Campylobacter fetus]OCR85727.1 membrane protein [Campylobacter fetus subsp. testudinum]